jgi:hypothetical protein
VDALQKYIVQMTVEEASTQANLWWDKLDTRRILAEDEEYQELHDAEECDDRAMARRIYRKRVVRALLSKGQTPTRTSAFLLDMAKMCEDALLPPLQSWREMAVDAMKHAPSPAKKT